MLLLIYWKNQHQERLYLVLVFWLDTTVANIVVLEMSYKNLATPSQRSWVIALHDLDMKRTRFWQPLKDYVTCIDWQAQQLTKYHIVLNLTTLLLGYVSLPLRPCKVPLAKRSLPERP
uniref:Uncharacterized protein n=1 Tax=Xenopsylla cheopis TaxID=163159 RepID=A0A6M2DXX9_XENCH